MQKVFHLLDRRFASLLDEVEEWLLDAGTGREVTRELRLVVEEGMSNVARYSYQEDEAPWARLTISVEDPSIPLATPQPSSILPWRSARQGDWGSTSFEP